MQVKLDDQAVSKMIGMNCVMHVAERKCNAACWQVLKVGIIECRFILAAVSNVSFVSMVEGGLA